MTTIHDKNRNATFYFAKNGMLNPVCRIVKQCKQKEAIPKHGMCFDMTSLKSSDVLSKGV